jgi:hypothetical protein
MDGWMDGRLEGRTDGQTDRQTDRRTDRQTDSENCMKMHVLIHNQYQAPTNRNVTKYAWYAAKLVNVAQSFLECKASRISG